jgi:manganese efflux pump family protein
MSYPEILLLALALSADAFSVGAALGVRYGTRRQIFRLAFHFGLFQALLPLVGALLGTVLLRWVEPADHWVAFGLLWLLGARMIYAASKEQESTARDQDLTRGLSLVGFSLAVSIDALAAGITLPATGAPIALAVVTFGIVTGLATFAAMRLAASLAARVGRGIEMMAGFVLLALGAKILNDHLHLVRLS